MEIRAPITTNADTRGGTPVFKGMRVPVTTLFEYLTKHTNEIEPSL